MTEIPVTQTLISVIAGAAGGGITSVIKYYVDRFTESHKASISIGTKRKERYYEKQAAVIAGTFERLSKYMMILQQLPYHQGQSGQDTLRVDQIYQGLNDLEAFFATNEIYFPMPLSSDLGQLINDLKIDIITHDSMLIKSSAKGTPDYVEMEKVSANRHRVGKLLTELKSKFRELLLGNDP